MRLLAAAVLLIACVLSFAGVLLVVGACFLAPYDRRYLEHR